MTASDLYKKASEELNGEGDGAFEASCIFSDLLGLSKAQTLSLSRALSTEEIALVNSAVKKRKSGYPLQYIIGSWDFYDMTFKVGEGVLIPRPETEQLVDFAVEKLKNTKDKVVFDLCAGSGCIGLSVAKHCPDALVYLFEKSPEAFVYLSENKEKYGLKNANLVLCDIFDFDTADLPQADIILSNPPYIPKGEIPLLQKEVQFEPTAALDGGADGLDFYRCISQKWLPKIKKGGFLAMECGDSQSKDIIRLFSGKFTDKKVIFDFNNIDRTVVFRI